MERRDLLKLGAAFGAALAGAPARADGDTAEASAARLAFFEGALQGEEFAAWTFWLAVVGKRAQGIVYDPATVGGASSELRALRLEGRVDGGLALHVYRWKDLNHTRPIGRSKA